MFVVLYRIIIQEKAQVIDNPSEGLAEYFLFPRNFITDKNLSGGIKRENCISSGIQAISIIKGHCVLTH